MTARTRTVTASLADQLQRSYAGEAWHGPSLAEALAGVGAANAYRRPLGGHSIAEIVAHVAWWLDAARDRIERGFGARARGSEWPAVGAVSAERWRTLQTRLATAHQRLHETVAALDYARLDDPVPGSDPTVGGMLLGVLQHNAYHAGQIALLARAVLRR